MHRPKARDLAARLIEARGSKGWSQRDLAAATALTQATIGAIERGASDPRVGTVERLARALECDPGWLAFGG